MLRGAISYLSFIASTSYLALFLSTLFGQLSTILACVSLGGGLFASAFVYFFEERHSSKTPNHWEWTVIGFVLISCIFHSMGLVYSVQGGLWALNPNNLGDLGLHIGMIRFLSHAEFPPTNPIFFSGDLDYPYAINLFNAVFEKMGIATILHMRWVMLLSSLVLIVVLWNVAGVWALGCFFFAASSVSVFDVDIEWKNFFLSLWTTQRGFLYAFPAGLVLFDGLLKWVDGKPMNWTRWLLFCAMPFFHLHSFFIISVLFVTAALLYRLRDTRFLWVFFTGALFAWDATDGFRKSGLVHWDWNWTISSGWELLPNFGVWPPLLGYIMFFLFRSRHPHLPLYLVCIGLFLFFMQCMLAPWAWDNIKVLSWLFLMALLIGYRTLQLRLSSRIGVLLFLGLFWPGIYEIFMSWPQNVRAVKIASHEELRFWRRATQPIPVNQRIAIYPSYNHPIALLGRPVFMGYPGHLWSHGIDHAEARRALDRAYLEGIAIDEIRYYAYGKREREGFSESPPELDGVTILPLTPVQSR